MVLEPPSLKKTSSHFFFIDDVDGFDERDFDFHLLHNPGVRETHPGQLPGVASPGSTCRACHTSGRHPRWFFGRALPDDPSGETRQIYRKGGKSCLCAMDRTISTSLVLPTVIYDQGDPSSGFLS